MIRNLKSKPIRTYNKIKKTFFFLNNHTNDTNLCMITSMVIVKGRFMITNKRLILYTHYILI